MNRQFVYLLAIVLACLLTCGCKGSSGKTTDTSTNSKTKLIGNFNADSAYAYVAQQVAFGPRVPGTPGHEQCAAYLVDKLRSFGADTIIEQRTTVTAFNGDVLPINNIFASFNSKAPNTVLLVAHWDTRPWANMESANSDRTKPIPGANDGGSGVGVLLEIARNLGIKKPDCGVDILLVDAEDYGSDDGFTNNDKSWCLGSQYWINHMPYSSVNRPIYGILLDMVGGVDAKFHREHFSHHNAKLPTVKVWSEASALGFDGVFVNKVGGAVVDDHVFITEAGIPTTDIIENINDVTGTFPATWHTLDDNMDNISKSSLDAVGKTVLNVIYKEKEL